MKSKIKRNLIIKLFTSLILTGICMYLGIVVSEQINFVTGSSVFLISAGVFIIIIFKIAGNEN